jgi:nitrous oxidase accessory protein NosD
MKKNFLIISLLVLLFFVSTVFATTRYVSTTGTDLGDFSNILNQCKTIGYALGQALDGDTIIVRAGNYNENLIITKPLTLRGAQVGIDARTRTTVEESTILSSATDGTIKK